VVKMQGYVANLQRPKCEMGYVYLQRMGWLNPMNQDLWFPMHKREVLITWYDLY
jgi:hypothetical protein